MQSGVEGQRDDPDESGFKTEIGLNILFFSKFHGIILKRGSELETGDEL